MLDPVIKRAGGHYEISVLDLPTAGLLRLSRWKTVVLVPR